MKLEHIGIAVSVLEESEIIFEKLLNTPSYKRETVEMQEVVTSFFATGESKVELLASTTETGPIARFIAKRGEGIHHLAFEVADIRQEMKRLQAEGFHLLQEEPSVGADNKWVCFIHPKTAHGVLIELCQSIPSGVENNDDGLVA